MKCEFKVTLYVRVLKFNSLYTEVDVLKEMQTHMCGPLGKIECAMVHCDAVSFSVNQLTEKERDARTNNLIRTFGPMVV